MSISALVIDSDELELHRIAAALRQADFEVAEAASAVEGLVEVLDRDPLLIVLAEEVAPLDAGEVLLVLRRLTDAPIMLVGSGGEPEERDILDAGGDFYLRRPFRREVLLARARVLLRTYRRSGKSDPRSSLAFVLAQGS